MKLMVPKNKDLRQSLYKQQKFSNKDRRRKEKKTRRYDEERDPSLKEQRLRTKIPNTQESKSKKLAEKDPISDEALGIIGNLFQGQLHSQSSRILITTSPGCSENCIQLSKDLFNVFPNSKMIRRRTQYTLSEICDLAAKNGYNDLLYINEQQKQFQSLVFFHLPSGPSIEFGLASVKLSKEIYGHGKESRKHTPELIMNNFKTNLGKLIAQFFQSLFIQRPELQYRHVITLHSQRDFIFFRRHRYIFTEKMLRGNQQLGTNLQEIGPRFTLKLRKISKNLADNETVYSYSPNDESKSRLSFKL